MNLARLTRAGFPVPPGFIITTEAYRRFVQTNHLETAIQTALDGLEGPADAQALAESSAALRLAFSAGEIPAEDKSRIRTAYTDLGAYFVAENAAPAGELPVAVRSSATAEDLPDLSFAGQQDTFLNVIGGDALLQAVVDCWSSLWTARAIGYRMRNGIEHSSAALAVVVQQMTPSEVSGVLFTANPLSGLRYETVIDATFGLGEALVAGQVEPDNYIVDTTGSEITNKTLGAKGVATRGLSGGGVETVEARAADRQALPDEAILRLAALGGQIQREYGSPQDIEWALAGGELYILQSRPITSLFPLPYERLEPLDIWFSFGLVQGILGPMTPLGLENIRNVFGGLYRLVGAQQPFDNSGVLGEAGERLWIKISDMMRNPLGSRMYAGVLKLIEPSTVQILEGLADDPRLGTGQGKLKLSSLRRLLRFFLPLLPRIAVTMRHPEQARAEFEAFIESELAPPAPFEGDRYVQLAERLAFMKQRIVEVFYKALPRFIPIMAAGMASLNLLNKLSGSQAESDHGFSALSLEATRGLPGNVTTEMDLALWRVATIIRADPDSMALFSAVEAPQLARAYLDEKLPQAVQGAVVEFMTHYGMRGLGEIDIGQPRWREDPTAIMQTLQSYQQIDPQHAPDALFERGAQAAEAAIEQSATAARQQPGGRVKEHLVRFAARRVRLLLGLREAPKFFAIRTMGMVRAGLLLSGEEFVLAGEIDSPDDLFYMRGDELVALSQAEARDWKALVAERRVTYAREARRKQAPRVLASDGRAFYEGLSAAADSGSVIHGSPVSPGVVEGRVRIVFDPRAVQLAPGEILVCPGTDPAWTPLFMAAGGLVTEVGGMMTHGSVVAREYGIPAVVGIHQATTRLKTGQRVRLDGTQGVILLLDDEATESQNQQA